CGLPMRCLRLHLNTQHAPSFNRNQISWADRQQRSEHHKSLAEEFRCNDQFELSALVSGRRFTLHDDLGKIAESSAGNEKRRPERAAPIPHEFGNSLTVLSAKESSLANFK